MSTIQTLRAFVNQRLAAAVEEIFGLLETTILKYEEEIERQRGLLKDADGHTHTADVRTGDQQEWRNSLYPEDIKEEQEELWSSQQVEQLQGLEEDDITRFPFTAVSVKTEDDNEDKTQSLQLHQRQSEESREAEPPASSSAQHMEIETDSTHQLQSLYCCVSETEDSNDEWKDVAVLRLEVTECLSAAAQHICELLERTVAEYEEQLCRSQRENERQRRLLEAVLKPEVRLHRTELCDVQQEPEPTLIKEEVEQLWNSPEREQLHGPVPLKDEEDEEEKTLQSEEHTAGSSAQHMETECNGEDRGRSGPTRSLDSHQPANDDETLDYSKKADWRQSREPQSDLTTVKLKQRQTQTGVSASQLAGDDRTSDFSEADTENNYDWKETRKHDNGVSVRDGECNTTTKSPTCCECGKTLNTMECVNGRDKPFACSVCVERSTMKAQLVPLRRTQSGKTSFICPICKKHFRYKGDTVKHIRIHTGERPYSCSICGRRFTQSTGLGTHMRTHTGERPHGCSVCPRRFIRSGMLARHMRVHTGEKPYSCSVCNMSFSLSQSLLKHMRLHTGEKPFSCSVCDRRFTQKGHLTQHMTLHTGEKSFSCNVCGKRFTRHARVKKHKCISESSSSSN
ncbi:Gastrula zinc finger protein XlCGF57.1 [Nibea albiflora]|uniref:Gastrula zinc finger protein XlCGF57.1 n=1 Tax=Nibea albiflora TaxID=240163 RepID=A0ACB7FD12_NIBAL|nr:Gastrula zinc finger protein XlCGF57.1 [Nibea albiflora]